MSQHTEENQPIQTNGANLIIYNTLLQAEANEHNASFDPTGSNDVLLTKNMNGRWTLPGGEVEYQLMYGKDHVEPYFDAALRETQEEIGLHIDVKTPGFKMEAIAQQRVFPKLQPTKDGKKITIIGTVCVYSVPLNPSIDSLTLQPTEVLEARWWNLHSAIKSEEVDLGYRRMLAVFAGNHQTSCRKHRRPTEFNLGAPITYPIGSDTFI